MKASAMRLRIAAILLTISTPLCAQTLGSTSGASSTLDITNPANSTTRLVTTPTVVPPGLAAAGVETCLGSASGGISLMGGGLTFGSTVVDSGCSIRLLSRQLFNFGFQKAAVALMCQDERVAVAMDRAGSPCPARPAEVRDPGHISFHPTNSFAEEDHVPAIAREEPSPEPAQEDQTEPPTQTAQVKPFTRDEQAMFNRASNIN
jgi:hypothetical protein